MLGFSWLLLFSRCCSFLCGNMFDHISHSISKILLLFVLWNIIAGQAQKYSSSSSSSLSLDFFAVFTYKSSFHSVEEFMILFSFIFDIFPAVFHVTPIYSNFFVIIDKILQYWVLFLFTQGKHNPWSGQCGCGWLYILHRLLNIVPVEDVPFITIWMHIE